MNQQKPSTAKGGYIMQLQDFSVNDGDGIRTNVFLSGCPLACKWCANPEGKTIINQMTHYISTEEVLSHIQHQKIFFQRSGGGVTFSGGEPTLQEDFLRKLVYECYDLGVNLAIETCGYFVFDQVKDILQKMDLIFMDLKHLSSSAHSFFTGKPVEKIMDNAIRTAQLGIPMVIRIPTIAGVNANDFNMKNTFNFIKNNLPGVKLELLPYHIYGVTKYEELGVPYEGEKFGTPSDNQMQHFYDLASSYGIEVISYK